MKIVIYGINYAPELTGIGKYSGEFSEWLAARGHDVRVVAAPPYYPDWRIWPGFSSVRYAKQGDGRLKIFRCALWVPSKPSGLKRLLHLVSYALSSFPVVLWQIFWRPNIVIVIAPAIFCAPASWLVSRLSGARAWLHIQDYEIDAAFNLGLLKGRLLRRVILSGERWLLRRFDRVSTISRRMMDRAIAKGVAPHRTVYFPNWVDFRSLQSDESSTRQFRAEMGIPPDAIVALYSGNMGTKQGLEILAEAAVRLQGATKLAFVFCGAGAGREALVAQCASLINVRFLNLQPGERLGALLGMADIHLLPQRADAADLVMPSKLTGMLASGKPVVATAHPDTEVAEIVQGCGLVVAPGDAAAFAAAIVSLERDAALRVRLGAAGLDYARRNLDPDAVLGRIEAEMQFGH